MPGSGKSIIANLLREKLSQAGIPCGIVSIDEVRKKFDLSNYDYKGRQAAYHKLASLVIDEIQGGYNVIIDATGNRKEYREYVSRKIRWFAMVYLKCPIEVCIKRELGRDKERAYLIYKQDVNVPGIHADYEEPETPDLILDTSVLTPEQSVEKIMDKLRAFFMQK